MTLHWMATGAKSQAALQQHNVEQEQAKAERGKMLRFFLKDGETARLIFVDGALTAEGYLEPPRFWEHFDQARKQTFVCPEKNVPGSCRCPICEGGDKPSLISLFTVIDLRPFKNREGVVVPFTRKLLAAKPMTFELLNKRAVKYKGLAGKEWEVTRTGDKAPAVGSSFDFETEHSHELLSTSFVRPFKNFETGITSIVNFYAPADYQNEIVFRTEAELRALGFGKFVGSPHTAPMVFPKAQSPVASVPWQSTVSQDDVDEAL